MGFDVQTAWLFLVISGFHPLCVLSLQELDTVLPGSPLPTKSATSPHHLQGRSLGGSRIQLKKGWDSVRLEWKRGISW